MNRWSVYEFLKHTYMYSGVVPSERNCIAKFGGLMDLEEIREGIAEFELVTRNNVDRIKPGRQRKRGA